MCEVMRQPLICLGLGLLLAGCRAPSTDPAATSASAPASAAAAAPPAASEKGEPAVVESAPPLPSDAGSPAPVGGNWLKCYANFQPRTQPDTDVLRLGLMCGPSNGMRKATESRGSELSAAGKQREHRFKAEAGECYRIFAVAEPSVEDLDVEVFAPSGAKIAFDTSDDRWPIVKPDGPFCVFEAGEYRSVVRAQRGHGRYAIEIWRLH